MEKFAYITQEKGWNIFEICIDGETIYIECDNLDEVRKILKEKHAIESYVFMPTT